MRTPSPLTIVCLSLCTGILTAHALRIGPAFLIISAAVSAILALIFVRLTLSAVFILLGSFFTGCALFANACVLPGDHIARVTPVKGASVILQGIVEDEPVERAKFGSFLIRAEKLSAGGFEADVCGDVLVNDFAKAEFRYGERWLLEGKLYKAPYFFISDKLNYREYLRNKNIYSVLSLSKGGGRTLLNSGNGKIIKSAAFRIRRKIKALANENMQPLVSGIFNALLIGDRGRLPDRVRDMMVNTGTIHVIAISGLHLGIIGYIVFLLFSFMRVPRKMCSALTFVFIIFYCVLTGCNAPVVRSAIMACAILLGYIIERRTDIYNSLSLAAIVMLLINPREIFDVSFQLSFMSMISLALMTGKVGGLFPDAMRKNAAAGGFIRLFSSSSAAWLGLTPLVAYYFGIVSPVAILANLVIVPYATIVLSTAVAFIISGLAGFFITPIFAAASEFSIVLLLRITEFFERSGGYFSIRPLNLRELILSYVVLAVFLNPGYIIKIFKKYNTYP